MTGLRPLFRDAAIFYYRWALKEISPTHPDVPHIVHRLRDLLEERAGDQSIARRIYSWL